MRRVLRGLPEPVLKPLARGLADAERLDAGSLFTDGGGCAVGVFVRTLFPDYRPRSGILFRRRQRSLAQVNTRLVRELPHLLALEQVFDRTVRLAESRGVSDPAAATGAWIGAEISAELELRQLRGGFNSVVEEHRNSWSASWDDSEAEAARELAEAQRRIGALAGTCS